MNRIALWTCAVFLYSLAADRPLHAANNVPVPNTIGVVYWVKGNELVRLEKTRRQLRTDTSDHFKSSILSDFTMGWSNLVTRPKLKENAMVEGAHSPVSVGVARPVFVGRMAGDFVATQLQLVPLKTVREHREFLATVATSGIAQIDVAQNKDAIELEASVHERDKNVTILTPGRDLQPGEYAIFSSIDVARNVYCFSVSSSARPGSGVVSGREDGPSTETAEEPPEDAASAPKRNPFDAFKKTRASSSGKRTKNGTPEEVLETFIRAQERGDVEQTVSLISRSSRPDFRKNAANMTKQDLVAAGRQFREAKYRMKSAKGASAILFSPSRKSYIVLVLEEDCWRVDPAKSEEMGEE